MVLFCLLSSFAAAQTGPDSVLPGASPAQSAASPADPAKYTDVTSALNINFEYVASHTSRKYLIETMGSGVAPFDPAASRDFTGREVIPVPGKVF